MQRTNFGKEKKRFRVTLSTLIQRRLLVVDYRTMNIIPTATFIIPIGVFPASTQIRPLTQKNSPAIAEPITAPPLIGIRI